MGVQCCYLRDKPNSNLIKPVNPEFKISSLYEEEPKLYAPFSSVKVSKTQEPSTLSNKRAKKNIDEYFFREYHNDERLKNNFNNELALRSRNSKSARKADSQHFSKFMCPINELSTKKSRISKSFLVNDKKNINNKKLTASLCLDNENYNEIDIMKENRRNRKSNSLCKLKNNDIKNELQIVCEKIMQLKEKLKSVPVLEKQNKNKIPNLYKVSHDSYDLNTPDKKEILIENLSYYEQYSVDYEENTHGYNSPPLSQTYSHRNVPFFEKYITYANMKENSEGNRQTIDVATDTFDLNSKNEKIIKSNVSVDILNHEIEQNESYEKKKIKSSLSGKKKVQAVPTTNKKISNIVQDLNKLKKLGFSFILKFTENSKPPLVKVGGGYVTLEQFLHYILDKINKSNALRSPKTTSETIDPELIERLNSYLTEMNNFNINKAQINRKQSFQGRGVFQEEKSAGMSPRGNFMKAVVEKENTKVDSRKSLHLTEDFTINVRK